jgi:hypothetical protein
LIVAQKSTYTYRVRKYAWGIWVALTAEAEHVTSLSNTAELIGRNVYFEFVAPFRLDELEKEFIFVGIEMMIPQLPTYSDMLLIRITNVEIAPVDYQPEGFKYAIAGWIAQAFELQYPQPQVVFAKTGNRYIFSD